jgi:DNA-binding NarL/FixJ family response regulator
VLCTECDGRLAAAYLAHAEAGDGPALLACADEFADIGATRYAAECAAAAAEWFAEAGLEDAARRAATRLRELHPAEQGGFAPEIRTPWLTALTVREAQLVQLTRQGLSYPEIADRLVLSVRTVESHMYRAMRKLGINDRRDF